MAGVREASDVRRHSDGEAKTRATVRDIDELYSALQSLVPKQNDSSRKTRPTKSSGGDSDNAKSPALQRRCNTVHITTSRANVDESLYRVVSAGDLNASSTSRRRDQSKQNVKRAQSLPTFLEETGDEQAGDEQAETKKKSGFFSIFGRRRRHSKPKAPKKRRSSWRAFFSSLSLRGSSTKRAKKSKRKQKSRNNNEPTTAVATKPAAVATKPAAVEITGQEEFPRMVRTRNVTPSLTRSATSAAALKTTSPRIQKRRAPEPPVNAEQNNTPEQRRHSFGNNIDDVDQVQKKISAWYKHAVRESNTEPRRTLRNYKSQENLLSAKEPPKPRNVTPVASSDTDGVTPENLENLRRIRARKTRARRNRQRERARWRSLPNVKLLSQVVDKETSDIPKEHNSEVLPSAEEQISPTYSKIVTPVEADIPLPEIKSSEKTPKTTEALTDFMRMRRDSVSQYISIRQRSKTSESFTRPLKLNFFYSESPSRETVHRTQSLRFPSKLWFTGDPETDNQVSLNTQRNPSRRHRKRKSFNERQSSRVSQQSPFYFPNDVNEQSKFIFPDVEEPEKEEAKMDSGMGSPSVAEEQSFGLTPVGKRKHSEDDALKLSWESEDSGWASRDFANRVEFGTQTDSQPRTIDIGENEGQATPLGQF